METVIKNSGWTLWYSNGPTAVSSIYNIIYTAVRCGRGIWQTGVFRIFSDISTLSSRSGLRFAELWINSYSFLELVCLVTGTRSVIIIVGAAVLLNFTMRREISKSRHRRLNAQIGRWDANSHVNWAGSSPVSHKRCSETRIQQFRKTRNPSASENTTEACAHCVANNILCVLVVGQMAPAVVALPVSGRSPGATPTSGEYYVKA